MSVSYTPHSVPHVTSTGLYIKIGSVALYYATSDCSDTPHSAALSSYEPGTITGTGFTVGSEIYKALDQSDTFSPLGQRMTSGDDYLVSSPCGAITGRPSKTYMRAQLVNSSLPVALPMGTAKIIQK